jgi:lipid-A-disaccharide synthase-like uncharacterized protein
MASHPPKKWVVITILLFFVCLSFVLVFFIFSGWPKSEKWFYKDLSAEQQLILLVALCGALGSFVHMVTSFTDYLGSKLLENSWIPWYLMRPFVGATLALSFYFIIRGGLVTIVQNGNEPVATDALPVNPFGVAAISILAGMFSRQAVDKLRELFENLFLTKEKVERANPLPKDENTDS